MGAGPAGVAAAVAASEALEGRRGSVLLLDTGPRPGGQIWRHRSRAELPALAQRWLAQLDGSGAHFLAGASVVDLARVGGAGPEEAGDPEAMGKPTAFRLSVEQGGAARIIHARRVILATGARELFLPFPGWTLPNVVGVGGAQALLRSGLAVAGRRVVVAGSGPLLLAVAAAMARAGAEVALVAEQAPPAALLRFGSGLWRAPARALQGLGYRLALGTTRYAAGCWVTAAVGDDVVREVTLTDGRRSWTERCDLLCTGYGLVPNTELAALLGCAVTGGRVEVDDWQRTTVPGLFCAGEPTGVAGVGAALAEGELAGMAAGGDVPVRSSRPRPRARLAWLRARRDRERAFGARLERAFAPRAELRALAAPDTIICRCEDIPLGALDPGWCARQAKLYTRAGMGPCQARVCGPALECLFGWEGAGARAPILPATVATLITTSESAEDAEGVD